MEHRGIKTVDKSKLSFRIIQLLNVYESEKEPSMAPMKTFDIYKKLGSSSKSRVAEALWLLHKDGLVCAEVKQQSTDKKRDLRAAPFEERWVKKQPKRGETVRYRLNLENVANYLLLNGIKKFRVAENYMGRECLRLKPKKDYKQTKIKGDLSQYELLFLDDFRIFNGLTHLFISIMPREKRLFELREAYLSFLEYALINAQLAEPVGEALSCYLQNYRIHKSVENDWFGTFQKIRFEGGANQIRR